MLSAESATWLPAHSQLIAEHLSSDNRSLITSHWSLGIRVSAAGSVAALAKAYLLASGLVSVWK
jgi:hypothetical protein